MVKTEELYNPASCMNKARSDEMTFVLLARDPAAPMAIFAWILARLQLGKNKSDDPQILDALSAALEMIRYRENLEDATTKTTTQRHTTDEGSAKEKSDRASS